MATKPTASPIKRNRLRYQTNCKVVTIATFTVLLFGTVELSSQAQEQAAGNAQVIKVKLNELAGVAEWVRVEVNGNRVRLSHSITSPSGISRALRSVIPLSINNTWYDHPTTRIVFQPDGCQETMPASILPTRTGSCIIVGRDFVDLPPGTNLFNGRFTVEYTRSDLPSSVTFRVPQQNQQNN
ncbi:hypothetical protein [Phormidesmis sp. 146-33]